MRLELTERESIVTSFFVDLLPQNMRPTSKPAPCSIGNWCHGDRRILTHNIILLLVKSPKMSYQRKTRKTSLARPWTAQPKAT